MSFDQAFVKAAATGFILGLGFIFSLGPQNLQLIRSGSSFSHATIAATTGYLSEVIIVSLGIIGMASPIETIPGVGTLFQTLGIVFLSWYGLRAIIRGHAKRLPTVDPIPGRQWHRQVVAMLSVTWLNPLVYVEIMFLTGAVASSFDSQFRIWFGAGFLLASALRFYGWTLIGRILQSWLTVPRHQRIFNLTTGLFLISSAIILARQVFVAPGTEF